MSTTRFSHEFLEELEVFVQKLGVMVKGTGFKNNSFGVEILAARYAGSDFSDADAYRIGFTDDHAEHDKEWYFDNAHGKKLVCLETGMDSHEAVRLYQGALNRLEGAFLWGGAIIDLYYGLIISTSGFNEDEDIFFSRAIRNWIVMKLDRAGQLLIDTTRARGTSAKYAADRFAVIAP